MVALDNQNNVKLLGEVRMSVAKRVVEQAYRYGCYRQPSKRRLLRLGGELIAYLQGMEVWLFCDGTSIILSEVEVRE
jgi:hypothetical protein